MNWKSAIKLAQSEGSLARNGETSGARIKNPLTPMRLTVQSFQRKFDPTDPNVKQK
jgi:hypothetical protein